MITFSSDRPGGPSRPVGRVGDESGDGTTPDRAAIVDRLRQYIVAGLHLGGLAARDRLPSTRTLAERLGVNPRRVMRAYHDLETAGLVERRPRSGFFVACSAARPPDALPAFDQWAIDTAVAAGELGVPPVALADSLRERLATPTLVAACIECNEDQRYGLAIELARDYGMETMEVPLEQVAAADVRSLLPAADAFFTTAFHASEVRRLGGALGKPTIAITIRPELRTWVARALQRDEMYFVAADARFCPKAAAMFRDLPGSHRIRVLVVGRDDLFRIPAAAPVYLTRKARSLLGDVPLARRAFRPDSLFSRESRRAIVALLMERSASRREPSGRLGR